MRLLTTLTFLLISSLSYGQGIWNQVNGNSKFWRLKADSVLIVPRDTSATNNAFYLGAPVGDSGRLAHFHGRFWGRDTTKFRSFAFSDEVLTSGILSDSLALENWNRVMSRGNSSSFIALANAGVGVTAGNLELGLNAGTSRLRTNRFVDLWGNSTGIGNGAVISFFKSNGQRVGALGDGSSNDDNIYLGVNELSDLRIQVSSGQLANDPFLVPLTVTKYSSGGKVLIGDTTIHSGVRQENALSVRSNPYIYNTLNKAPVIEFNDGNYNSLRVGVGMQGQPEANLFANMYYYNRVHKYYDSTFNAIWLALSPIVGGMALQYAPKGLPHSSSSGFDIWSQSGSRYLWYVDTSVTRLYSVSGTFGIDFKRAKSVNNQGLSFDVGGGTSILNSYDSTNVVFSDFQLRSTKGSANKVLAYLDGDSGNMGVGASLTPTSTLHVQGAVSFPFAATSVNLTLDNTHHTVRVTATSTITLPAASSCLGRVYCIINYNTGGNITTSAYLSPLAVSTTTVANGTTLWVQSDGTNWYQIK